jgi:hypothetical protein
MNVTMVACYGDKPPALAHFIAHAQALLGEAVPSFVPYDMRQVHATLIGLEGRRLVKGDGVLNANYRSLRGERRLIDLAGALDLVRESLRDPLHVRIGGFPPGGVPPFLSRGRHPYERSFSISGEMAVAMGWPREQGGSTAPLARLRRDFESFGVLHKYHVNTEDADNDFFLVLGRLRAPDGAAEAGRGATAQLRASMARAPCDVVVDLRDIRVVAYVDAPLPLETSVSYPLSDVDVASLVGLYPVGE